MPDTKVKDIDLTKKLIRGGEAEDGDDDDVDDPEPDRYEEDDRSDEEEDPTREGGDAGAEADAPGGGQA